MFLGYIHFWSFTFFLLGDFITQSTTYIAWLCDKAWCMSLLITLALVWGKGLHSSAGRNVKLLFKECFLPCMNISNDMDEHSLTILVLIDYITVVLFCFVFFFHFNHHLCWMYCFWAYTGLLYCRYNVAIKCATITPGKLSKSIVYWWIKCWVLHQWHVNMLF